MKRKIKKHLFHVNEIKQIKNLLESPDHECIELGIQILINSKPYKHYISSRFPPTVIRYLVSYGKTTLFTYLNKYSHLKYKK